MSCNGCRVLRKGCGESCILRPCLSWIDGVDAQGHATIFVAKFFGRAGLLSFVSAVPEPQRPALFRSLLFEACGRTVSPVHGAVGLLWSGNWRICQEAVETVLRGGTISVIPEFLNGTAFPPIYNNESSDGSYTFDIYKQGDPPWLAASHCSKRVKPSGGPSPVDLELSLTTKLSKDAAEGEGKNGRPGTPSMNSEESVTTMTCFESSSTTIDVLPKRLVNLFDD